MNVDKLKVKAEKILEKIDELTADSDKEKNVAEGKTPFRVWLMCIASTVVSLATLVARVIEVIYGN